MDWPFLLEVGKQLLAGLPLTLQLAASAIFFGFILAVVVSAIGSTQLMISSWLVRLYVELFRGTPLLVQIFLIYYGVGQIPFLRGSFLWPLLSQAYWCAIVALSLNTSAYGAEIIRGALATVPKSAVEAARSFGMSGFMLRRRIIWPMALRYGLITYGNEAILMLKATSLASVITLMDVTGVAHKLIASSYRPLEIFVAAGAIYLSLSFIIAAVLYWLEHTLNPHMRG